MRTAHGDPEHDNPDVHPAVIRDDWPCRSDVKIWEMKYTREGEFRGKRGPAARGVAGGRSEPDTHGSAATSTVQ